MFFDWFCRRKDLVCVAFVFVSFALHTMYCLWRRRSYFIVQRFGVLLFSVDQWSFRFLFISTDFGRARINKKGIWSELAYNQRQILYLLCNIAQFRTIIKTLFGFECNISGVSVLLCSTVLLGDADFYKYDNVLCKLMKSKDKKTIKDNG